MAGSDDRTVTRRDLTLLAFIVVLAALVRIVGVNFPPRTAVDEFWYARDGCYYWKASADACGMADLQAPDRDVPTWLATYGELTPEHPPLAKWLIGAPMAVLCYCPSAWRLASVAAGILTVALLYLLALQAFRSTAAAVGASALLAIDYLHLIHSRLATLEIFVALFAVAAFYCCFRAGEQISRRARGLPSHRYWLLAAGLAGGAAAASKLSGIAVVVGVLVLVIGWEIAAHRRVSRGMEALLREMPSVVILLVIVPVAAYVATYAGRLDGTLLTVPWAEESWLRAWVERQLYILDFHAAKPPGLTSPWTVPMIEEPLAYVLQRTDGGVREILLFGNPLLWWGGFAAVVYVAIRWVRGEGTHQVALTVIGFVAAYAGWLNITLTGRPVHLFYAVPVAPFLYLSLAYVAVHVASSRVGRGAITAVLATAAIAFVFFLPIIIGWPLANADWQLRACAAQTIWLEPVEGCTSVPFR